MKKPMNSRRLAAAAALAVCSVMAFAALGGVGLAQNSPSASQKAYGKVTICHKGKTITVSENAWPAHQRHGDTRGSCQSAAAKAKAAKVKAAKIKAAKAKAAKAKAAKAKAAKEEAAKKGEKPGKGGKGKGK